MADRAMAWIERPVDFVSTFSATTVNGLHVAFAFWFPNKNTEVVSAHRAGSGKVYSHLVSLTLPVRPFNVRAFVNQSCTASESWSIQLLQPFAAVRSSRTELSSVL
jgi:hypothetical protein